jgi:hypothetical protein
LTLELHIYPYNQSIIPFDSATTIRMAARILRARRDGSSDSFTIIGSQRDAQVQVSGTQEPENLQQALDVQQSDLPNRPRKRTRKEERDDELHALELEAKRAMIEHENEVRRRALQQQEELHQLKLAQFSTEYTPNLNDQDDEGEIPLEAKAVSLLFPSAPQREVAAIFNNKFDPSNLYKLCRKIGLLSDADDQDISFTRGKLRSRKRTGTFKDYPSTTT